MNVKGGKKGGREGRIIENEMIKSVMCFNKSERRDKIIIYKYAY